MVSLAGNRDTAAAGITSWPESTRERMAPISNGISAGFGDAYHAAVAASGILLHDVSILFFRAILACSSVMKWPDWLGRSFKGRIVCIYTDLCNHGCNRNIIHFTVIEFLS